MAPVSDERNRENLCRYLACDTENTEPLGIWPLMGLKAKVEFTSDIPVSLQIIYSEHLDTI
jgi:hypothetical protein